MLLAMRSGVRWDVSVQKTLLDTDARSAGLALELGPSAGLEALRCGGVNASRATP